MSCMESETRLALLGLRPAESSPVTRPAIPAGEYGYFESLRPAVSGGFACTAAAVLLLVVSIAATLGV